MKFANITLTDGQSQVILSKANKVDIGGSSCSGKTTINKILALMVAEQVPGAKIAIIRRTYKNLLNDYFKGGMSFENMIKAEVDGESTFKSNFTIDKSKLTVEFENGSKIYGFGCDNQEDVLQKLSEHYFDLIIVDEGLISSEIIEFSKTRLKVNSEIKDKFWTERLPRFQWSINTPGYSRGYMMSSFISHKNSVILAPIGDNLLLDKDGKTIQFIELSSMMVD